MNLPDEKREAFRVALERAYGCKSGQVHEGYGAECASAAHAPALYRTFGCDHVAHLADALAPLLAGWLAEARGEDRVVSVRHESDCDWVTNNSWCSCGLDDAFEAGLAEGEARARARVEALCGCDSTGCPCGGDRASVPTRELRAALDTDADKRGAERRAEGEA